MLNAMERGWDRGRSRKKMGLIGTEVVRWSKHRAKPAAESPPPVPAPAYSLPSSSTTAFSSSRPRRRPPDLPAPTGGLSPAPQHQNTSRTPAGAEGNQILRNTPLWHRAGEMEKGTRGEFALSKDIVKALVQTRDSTSLQRDGNDWGRKGKKQEKSGILTDGASNPAPQARFPALYFPRALYFHTLFPFSQWCSSGRSQALRAVIDEPNLPSYQPH